MKKLLICLLFLITVKVVAQDTTGEADVKLAKEAIGNEQFDQAASYLEKAITFENAEAMYLLYILNNEGIYTKMLEKNAFVLLEKAVALDYIPAIVEYANVLTFDDRKINYNKAHEYATKAAKKNNTGAMYLLGYLNEEGLSVPINFKTALYWYKEAAKLGDEMANGTGVHLVENMDSSIDEKIKELNYFAQLNSNHALYHLGHRYIEKALLPDNSQATKDLENAVSVFTKAANKGYVPAMNSLGDYYLSYDNKNVEKAIEWYKKAWNKDYPESGYKLGMLNKDTATSFTYFLKAADLGSVDAMEIVLQAYYEGFEGIEKNVEKAKELENRYKEILHIKKNSVDKFH